MLHVCCLEVMGGMGRFTTRFGKGGEGGGIISFPWRNAAAALHGKVVRVHLTEEKHDRLVLT